MTIPSKPRDNQSPDTMLSPQQRRWQSLGYPASEKIQRVTKDQDGNIISIEEDEPERPVESHPITPEEFNARKRGGRAKRKPGGKIEGAGARGHLGRRARGAG